MRNALLWIALAVAGFGVTGAATYATSRLSDQTVGRPSAPPLAGEELAPAAARPTTRPTTSTKTTTTPTTTPTTPPKGTPPTRTDDGSGGGDDRRPSGDGSGSDD